MVPIPILYFTHRLLNCKLMTHVVIVNHTLITSVLIIDEFVNIIVVS